MGIRVKMLLGFLILAVMLFIAGAWSIYELSTIGASVQSLLDDNYKSIKAAKLMDEALEREDSAILILLSGKWKEGRLIIEPADDQFQKSCRIAENNITISGEKEILLEIRSKYKNYKELWSKPIVGTQHERNLDWYFSEVHRAFLDVKQSVEKLKAMNDQEIYQTASSIKNRAHRAVMPGVVAILASLIFTIIFNYLVNCFFVTPIINLANGIHRFLKTQEPLDIKIKTNDEILQLTNSVRDMMTQCRVERQEQ